MGRVTDRLRRARKPDPVVFVGPSLAADAARAVLPAVLRPPAALGDVHAAVLDGARVVVLIDGYFERVPAVWHKELLFALAQGVALYGAASMGALRAAELDRFGMVGVGEVYRQFRAGELTGDDEVTVVHSPARGGFRPMSEALVNIRATVAAAVRARVVPAPSGDELVRVAKATFYPERGYDRLLADAARAGVRAAHLDAFSDWLPAGRVDRKGADALAVLRRVRADQPAAATAPRSPFEQTWIWRDLIAIPVETRSRPTPGLEEWH